MNAVLAIDDAGSDADEMFARLQEGARFGLTKMDDLVAAYRRAYQVAPESLREDIALLEIGTPLVGRVLFEHIQVTGNPQLLVSRLKLAAFIPRQVGQPLLPYGMNVVVRRHVGHVFVEKYLASVEPVEY